MAHQQQPQRADPRAGAVARGGEGAGPGAGTDAGAAAGGVGRLRLRTQLRLRPRLSLRLRPRPRPRQCSASLGRNMHLGLAPFLAWIRPRTTSAAATEDRSWIPGRTEQNIVVVACPALHDPLRCRSRLVDGAEGTGGPAREWQPASRRGNAWEGSRLPRPACACPVLGWVSPSPATPSTSAEDALGGKKGLALRRIAVQYARCIPLQCVASPSVASRHSTPHRRMSGITLSASLRYVALACARGSPHMEAIFPQVFRLVCLAGAPVSMEMKCSVSSPVEMPLPLLRLS